MWSRLVHRSNAAARQRARHLMDKRRLFRQQVRHGHVIGIDLGTTNSCVSVVEGEGQEPKIIENADGARTTPSIVYLGKEAVVGVPAKRGQAANPLNTFHSTKRLLGKQYDDFDIQADKITFGFEIKKGENGELMFENKGKPVPPQQISAYILMKMKETAEMHLGETVTECVISVPAYFDEGQRQATKDAATIAGMEVKALVNEPTAAAVAYALDKKQDCKILVYDLGGGTFDVTVLQLQDETLQVLATSGDTYLGGDDFDLAIMDYIQNIFLKETGIDLSEETLAIQRIKEAAEVAKLELTNRQNTEINLPFLSADETGPKHLSHVLTRAQFEQMTLPFINKTFEPVDLALSDAQLEVHDITDVVLVGGMTRMPKIQQMLRDKFSRDPIKIVNPDEVVAAGAAVLGFGFSDVGKKLEIIDVNNLSVGIEMLGGLFQKVISRNRSLPTSKIFDFTTAVDDQTSATIKVYQGEREMANDNKYLGSLEVIDLPPMPRGQLKIKIKLEIDEQGMVSVSHYEKDEEDPVKQSFESVCSLPPEEIEKLIKESQDNFQTDRDSRDKQELQNEVDQLLWSLKHLTDTCSEQLSEYLNKEAKKQSKTALSARYGGDLDDMGKCKTKLELLMKQMHDYLKKIEEAAHAAEAEEEEEGESETEEGEEKKENSSENEKEGENIKS